jgi:hypothetical protein
VQTALGSVDYKAIVPVLLQHADLVFDEWLAKLARSYGNRQAQVEVASTAARSCQLDHQNAEEPTPATKVTDLHQLFRQSHQAHKSHGTCL